MLSSFKTSISFLRSYVIYPKSQSFFNSKKLSSFLREFSDDFMKDLTPYPHNKSYLSELLFEFKSIK